MSRQTTAMSENMRSAHLIQWGQSVDTIHCTVLQLQNSGFYCKKKTRLNFCQNKMRSMAEYFIFYTLLKAVNLCQK